MKYYTGKEIATGRKVLIAKNDFDELPREKAIQSLLDMGIKVNTDSIYESDFDDNDCWDALGGDWEG